MATTPRAETELCEVCGRKFNGVHGLGVHLARTHNKSETPKKRPGRAEVREKRASRKADVVLREVWADGNGRILLTDQDGNWWAARKLDV